MWFFYEKSCNKHALNFMWRRPSNFCQSSLALDISLKFKMWSNFLCVYSAMNMILQRRNVVSATKNLHIILSSTFLSFMCVFCKKCSIQNINTTIMDKYVALSWPNFWLYMFSFPVLSFVVFQSQLWSC